MTYKFTYKELTHNGKILKGSMNASSEMDVVNAIKERGSTAIQIQNKGRLFSSGSSDDNKNVPIWKREFKISFFEKKVRLKHLSILCRQMSTMLSSGMNLIRTLEVVSEQTENRMLKNVLGEITKEVQKGYQFSTCLKAYPNVFPELFINMVQSAELTGNLDSALASLSTHFTKEAAIQSKVRNAMIYPIVLSIAATLSVSLILITVIPVFIDLFESADAQLPLITRMLISISNFLATYWIHIIVSISAVIFIIKKLLKKEKYKYKYDLLIARIPVVNSAVTKIVTSRYTRTTGTLLSSGIQIIDALESAAKVTNNIIIIKATKFITDEIKKGVPLSVLLKSVNYFPPMMVSMIAIGEESGNLEEMLDKTATYYDVELEESITKLTAMLEPLMIIIMAIIIGFIVIAVLLPMFTMSTVLSS